MIMFTEANLKEAIDKQFEIAGYTLKYEDVKLGKADTDSVKWFMRYMTNKEKEKEFTERLIDFIKNKLHYSKNNARKQASRFILAYGLKVDTDRDVQERYEDYCKWYEGDPNDKLNLEEWCEEILNKI